MRRIKNLVRVVPVLPVLACGAHADASDGGGDADRGRTPEWRIDSTPSVRIGVPEGDPRDVLYRVAGAVRLDDGSVVVANAGTHELRVYDPGGRFVASLGREGRGPGEFESLAWVGRMRGDTIVAWDSGLVRWSIFTVRGGFVRSVTPQPEPPGMFPQVRGVLDDGSLVISSGWDVTTLARAKPGVRRDSVTLLRYPRDGKGAETLARVPGTEEYVTKSGPSFATNPYPFARELFVAAHGSHVYVGDSDAYRVRVLDSAGRPAAEAARPVQPVQISSDDRERYRRDRLARIQVESYRRRQEELLARIPFPETFPAFSALRVDGEGNLWIADYSRPGTPRAWSVWDPSGRERASARTPQDLEVLQIGADFVLGRSVDGDGTEQVRVYRLTRS